MSNQGSTDALYPGKGYTPDYGINESTEYDDHVAAYSKSIQSSSNPSLPSPGSHKNDKVWVVAMCALIACLASLVIGLMLGFTSPTLDKLDSVRGVHYIKSGSGRASLLGTLGPIGGLLGGLVAWPISEQLGRQAALMLSGVPALAGWLMITYSTLTTTSSAFLGLLYVGRVLTGFSTGWAVFCVSVYIAEIAPARLKGLFGNCNQLFMTFGQLIAYLYGINQFNIQYWHFSLAAAGVVTLFEILMLFTYETPRWLFSKQKDFDAIRVLKILRGPSAKISKEISQIKAGIREKYTIVEQLKAFRHRAVFIPFILVLMLMFFQQFSGINAVIFYASDVFKQAGFKDHNVNLVSAISIGVVQVIATLISVVLVDKLGRKVLLTVSSIGMGLSSFVLGIYYYILHHHCENCLGPHSVCNHSRHSLDVTAPCNTFSFGYLAVVCVVFFIISFSLAWGPIPWTMMSELMPNRVRTLAGSIATFVNWTFAAIISSSFHSIVDKITGAGAFWIFAAVMAFAIIFVIIFVPETKGHTLEEIQENFEKGRIIAISCGDTCGRRRPRGLLSSISRFTSTTRSNSINTDA